MTSRTDVASIIDHTLLKPEATPEQFRALVNEAAELGTYSVCVSRPPCPSRFQNPCTSPPSWAFPPAP